MKVQCKKCSPKEGIEISDFSQTEKQIISTLTVQSAIQAVKYLTDNYRISHTNAKYIVTHINKSYAHCNRCSFDKLNAEYITCPKCGALNFNWEIVLESI